jgi:hypothetical protein
MLRLPSADPEHYTKSHTHRTKKDDDNQSVNSAAKRRVTVIQGIIDHGLVQPALADTAQNRKNRTRSSHPVSV